MESVRNIVFIIDDDMTILAIAKRMLETHYEVFTMPSGKKLFETLEKLTPSLILLDVEMPEMDGFDIIKKLKLSEKTANIPVIFLTGTLNSERETKGRELGAIDFLVKPFSKSLLLEMTGTNIIRKGE
jgi:putative two-component system response regulator